MQGQGDPSAFFSALQQSGKFGIDPTTGSPVPTYDDVEIDHLQANAFNNLVLLLIKDDALLKRLKAGTNLYWFLPSGKYHAVVTGLGDAFERLRRCEQGKQSSR